MSFSKKHEACRIEKKTMQKRHLRRTLARSGKTIKTFSTESTCVVIVLLTGGHGPGRASPVRNRPRRPWPLAVPAPRRGVRRRRAVWPCRPGPGHGPDLLQNRDDLVHGGPVLVVGGEAPQRQLRRALRAP
jgi:hypothetical protein